MDEYVAMVEWYWQGKTDVLGEKPVPVPLCPPQIPYGGAVSQYLGVIFTMIIKWKLNEEVRLSAHTHADLRN